MVIKAMNKTNYNLIFFDIDTIINLSYWYVYTYAYDFTQN